MASVEEITLLREAVRILASRQVPKVIIHPVGSKIGIFSGDSTDLKEFKEQVEYYWEEYGIDSVEGKLRVLWRHLSQDVGRRWSATQRRPEGLQKVFF